METLSPPCQRCSLKKFRFFKVLIGDFRSSLEIPPAFRMHIKIKKSETAMVQHQCGRYWEVELTKSGNRMMLTKGWEIFVQENELEVGYLLVFQYDGGLHFRVTVFDTTACEKRFCALDSSNCDDRLHPGKIRLSSRDKKRARHTITSKAWDLACSFESPKPSFKRVVGGPDNYKVTIPAMYKGRGLPISGWPVKLVNSDGVQWSVRYVETEVKRSSDIGRQVSRSLGAGWHQFYTENGLKEGDACVFEFVKKCRLLVHIFRDIQE